jgi:hypothetical protein
MALEVSAAAKGGAIRLQAPPRLAFTGATDVADTLPLLARRLPSLAVRLKPYHARISSSSEDYDFGNSFSLGLDGMFWATGIAPGEYEVQLLCSGGFRSGSPQKVPAGRVQVPLDAARLSVSVAAAMPGMLAGKITGPVPAGRLGVVSVPTPADTSFGFTQLFFDGPATAARPDGSFELIEPPGERTVVVLDLLSGAILARTAATRVTACTERRLDFELDAARIDVVLGGPGWSADESYVLEVRPRPSAWPRGLGRISESIEPSYCGMGFQPPPGTRQFRLWLPAAEFELRAYHASQARMEQRKQVGVAAITTEAREQRDVTIELPKAK